MNKIIVVNGKFYGGSDSEHKLILKDKRSEAVVIRELDEYKIVIGAIFCRVMAGELNLKRVEVLDVVDNRNNTTPENPPGSIS